MKKLILALFSLSILLMPGISEASNYRIANLKTDINYNLVVTDPIERGGNQDRAEFYSWVAYPYDGSVDINFSTEFKNQTISEEPSLKAISLIIDYPSYNDFIILKRVTDTNSLNYTYSFQYNYFLRKNLYLKVEDYYDNVQYISVFGNDTLILRNEEGNMVHWDSLKTVDDLEIGPNSSANDLNKIKEAFRLIKTANSPKVYLLCNKTGYIYYIPDWSIVKTWFSDIKIDIVEERKTPYKESLADYHLKNELLSLRPGALVKTADSNEVYLAVSNGYTIKIEDEAAARALKGANWNKEIYTIPNYLLKFGSFQKYLSTDFYILKADNTFTLNSLDIFSAFEMYNRINNVFSR